MASSRPLPGSFQQPQLIGGLPRWYILDQTDPHCLLYDFLQNVVTYRQGRWSSTVKASLLRTFYISIWWRTDWLAYYLVDKEMIQKRGIADWLIRDENELSRPWSLFEHQAKQRNPVPKAGRMCGKTLRRFDRTYTCKTCSLDGSCVLCVDCFQASDHEGHEVLFSQAFTFSATCDCGDPSAWKNNRHLGCAHHPSTGAGGRRPSTTTAPPALVQALTNTITICIEFIIQVLQHSLWPTDFNKLPKTEEEMMSPDVPTGEPRESRGKGPWATILWSDDKHVAKEVTRQIRDALGCSWDLAEKHVKEVDQVGRKTIYASSWSTAAFHLASMFQQIDLGVTLRPAHDAFKEDLVGVIIDWLSDLCQCSVGGDDDLVLRVLNKVLHEPRFEKKDGHPGTPLTPDLKELEYDLPPHMAIRRIDWLMQLDSKMWKKAKWEWRRIYAWIYALGWDQRKELASRVSFNYVRLFEHYIYQDRDIDSNLLYCIAYMVFGNGPACAWASTRQNLFNSVVDVAYAWYTSQVILGRLTIPPVPIDRTDRTPAARVNVEQSAAFRGKKGLTVFGHIRSLLRHEAMQRIVAADEKLFNRVVDFLNLFVGMQTQKKEIDQHVEFEVDWPRTFLYLPELARTARELGETMKYAVPPILFTVTASIASRIYADFTLQSNTLDPEKNSVPQFVLVEGILDPTAQAEIFSIDTLQIESFSFHHYMNLLLGEILKHFRMLPFEDRRYNGMDMKDVFNNMVLAKLRVEPELAKMIIFEWPIQKLAILSHIKADLWRKNGVGMRAQLHHYREVSIREATVDLEFWTLQYALCVMNNLQFFTILIDRWGLAPFFSENVNSPEIWQSDMMDPKQHLVIIEDFLMLCIYLCCDMSIVNGWSQDQLTKHYLIHILALNTMSYSEILKKLPERSVETSFLPILNEVAEFRQPTETVLGAYILKPEFLDQVDPYWRHYTRNDQRNVIEKKLARMNDENAFIKPAVVDRPGPSSPFCDVARWVGTPVICHIIHYVLAHSIHLNDPAAWPGLPFLREEQGVPQFDLILDLVLHLLMIALEAQPHDIAMASVDLNPRSRAMSTFQNLWFMQTNEAFKPWKPRLDYIMGIIVSELPPDFTQDYRAQQAALAAQLARQPVVKPDVKGAAAARQKAIMAEFAKKQADFAAFMDEDDDEELPEAIDEEEELTYGQCIVCQDEVTPKNTGGMLALLQPSRILREVVNDRDWFEESLAAPTSLDQATRYHRFGLGTAGDPISTDGYPAANCKFGVYMSACSHLMHETCMMTYFEATRLRHAHQVQRHHPENAVRSEYLCPLCKSLGNVLIPLDSTITKLKPPISPVLASKGRLPTLSEKIRDVSSEGLLKIRESAKIWDFHVETGELTPWFSDTNFSLGTMDPVYRRSVKPTARMIDRIRSLLRPLSEQSQRIRNKKIHMYLPDEVVAYTVSTCEVAQRGFKTLGKTVAEGVPETSLKLVKQLIGELQLELDIYFGPRYDRTALRVGLFARLLPDWYRASTLPSPLLLRNPLVLVIETAAIAPDLLHAMIIMCYYAELTRTMLGLSMWAKRCLGNKQQAQPRSPPLHDDDIGEALTVFEGFRPIMQAVLRNNAGPFTDTDGILNLLSDEVLSKLLYSHTLPFLRRAAIVFYAVSGTYPNNDPIPENLSCEYTRLLHVLAIPPPLPTLSNPHSTESPIVARWLTQWALQGRIVPQLEYPGTYELYRLPMKWEDVMIKYADHKCSKCKTRPTYPALCLYCGAFVCLGGDCCMEGEQGECNIHMRDCGGATGMFVDIKRWLIVYLYAGSGSFGHMPYLDPHGELDFSMRRGHRFFMHIGRMDELRKGTWLQHTIPHLTARKLELTSDGGGWGTL